MQSMEVSRYSFAEGGPCLTHQGISERTEDDDWTDCKQEAMHLLVLIFGRRQRKMCFEARKGGGNGNTSSPRQGRAAGISLLTNPGSVWVEGDGGVIFSFCLSCMKYFGASSRMISKSYSETQELTAGSAESWVFNGRKL